MATLSMFDSHKSIGITAVSSTIVVVLRESILRLFENEAHATNEASTQCLLGSDCAI